MLQMHTIMHTFALSLHKDYHVPGTVLDFLPMQSDNPPGQGHPGYCVVPAFPSSPAAGRGTSVALGPTLGCVLQCGQQGAA